MKLKLYTAFTYCLKFLLIKSRTVSRYLYSVSKLDTFVQINSNLLFEPLLREKEISIKNQSVHLYYSHTNDISKWRYDTLYTKEPETLEWIDTHVNEKDVFWDIGANVGIYSIYAALSRKAKVYAFEPSFVNYYYLSANIVRNNLGKKIAAFPIALCEDTNISAFNMHSLRTGHALAHFGDEIDKMPFYGQEEVHFRQAVMGFNADTFIKVFPDTMPTHIKIDVDGIEPEIIKGMPKTLQNPELKCIQVEIDEKEDSTLQYITSILSDNQFRLLSKKHAQMFDHSKYSSVYNYLFIR